MLMVSAPLVALTVPIGCDGNCVHIGGVAATYSDRMWVIPSNFAFLFVLSLGPIMGLRMKFVSATLRLLLQNLVWLELRLHAPLDRAMVPTKRWKMKAN